MGNCPGVGPFRSPVEPETIEDHVVVWPTPGFFESEGQTLATAPEEGTQAQRLPAARSVECRMADFPLSGQDAEHRARAPRLVSGRQDEEIELQIEGFTTRHHGNYEPLACRQAPPETASSARQPEVRIVIASRLEHEGVLEVHAPGRKSGGQVGRRRGAEE